MVDRSWSEDGPDDATARRASVPAFIEVGPGEVKPFGDCTADELEAARDARMLQAKALMLEAHWISVRVDYLRRDGLGSAGRKPHWLVLVAVLVVVLVAILAVAIG
jgi:hypothetical protein